MRPGYGAKRGSAVTASEKSLSDELVRALRSSFRGELIQAGDPAYDEARTIWNAMVDHKPALVARCVGAPDVMRAVELARARDLLLSVRGGGHSVAGHSVCDGGLMIDLSAMKGIHV